MSILLGTLLAVGGLGLALFGKGSQEVAKEKQNQVYELSQELQQMQKEAQSSMNQACDNLNKKQKSLANLKKQILKSTLKNFVDVFEKIHNIDFTNPNISCIDFNNKFKSILNDMDYTYTNAKYRQEASLGAVALQTVLSPPIISSGLILKGYLDYYKASNQLDTLEADKKRMQAVQEDIKAKVLILNDSSAKCEEIDLLLKNLSNNLRFKTEKLSLLAEQRKFDYKKFKKTERETLFVCVNLAKCIKDLIDKEVVFEDGSLNPECVNTISLVQEQLESEDE